MTDQATGLYRVDKDEDGWNTDSERLSTMEYSHCWNNAHYAAVSGKFDDKEEAGRLLITHIINAYNAALKPKDLTIGKNTTPSFGKMSSIKKRPTASG